MKKLHVIGAVTAGVVLLSALGGGGSKQTPSSTSGPQKSDSTSSVSEPAVKIVPICDGSTVTTNCTVDSVSYKTYIYHPEVPEKSHTEQVTTYKKEVSGYCTLCNDDTYSPSCATGSGACSHHGGVAQWNAPRYSNVPVYSNQTIVDSPAQAAYYEKITN